MAAYLRNRMVCSGLDNDGPIEVWSNIGHLQIFGSTDTVHVPKEKRQKWD